MTRGVKGGVKVPVLVRMVEKINRQGPVLVPELGACWEWIGARSPRGYGRIRDEAGRLVYPHRVALAAHLGRPLGPGMFANHRCDNKACVRPTHLYEGTQSENERDKGYWGPVRPPKGDAVTLPMALAGQGEQVA